MRTRINLLPWRETRRREQDRRLLAAGMGLWLIATLAVFYAYTHVGGMIETQTRRNDFLKDELKKVEAEIREIAELKKQRADIVARMNVIYRLQEDRTRVVHLFDEMTRRVPEGAYLTSIKHVGGSLALTGIAQSNARVSALMRSLGDSPWFMLPELEVINVKQRGADRLSEYALKVKEEQQAQHP